MQSIAMPEITYDSYEKAPAFAYDEENYFLGLIRKYTAKRVLEVGSGANPTLSADHAAELGFQYITSDVSEDELAKAPAGIEARIIDFASDQLPTDLLGSCDLIFSRWVNEHVKDAKRYHQNIRRLLKPGGIAVHCFPCLFTLPFLLNRIVPETLSNTLLSAFSPRDQHQHGKFRAYYNWCRGPTAKAIRNFEGIGYEVITYKGYFGHYYYKNRLKLLDRMEMAKIRFLLTHPIPELCAFAIVILRRRDD
ncbi:MAG TPA: class I SAM-dependent methyltransferase [Crenalkalicoccus sp.]|nr:class I SAM-dependent methyltransferase [Crenalkalicoccus sp.]